MSESIDTPAGPPVPPIAEQLTPIERVSAQVGIRPED